jgi:hypothetical protein
MVHVSAIGTVLALALSAALSATPPPMFPEQASGWQVSARGAGDRSDLLGQGRAAVSMGRGPQPGGRSGRLQGLRHG